MINSLISRRNFLGSMALLSVGTAFGAVNRLVPETTSPDLQQAWKQFYRQNGGQAAGPGQPVASALPACKGHWYENGSLIAFHRHNLLAQPTWIFWSEEKKKPADIIITLFKNDAARTKLGRLNRFEWEALQSLSGDSEQNDGVALMKATCRPTVSGQHNQASPTLKVAVRKGRSISITARLNQKEHTIKKQFLYSI